MGGYEGAPKHEGRDRVHYPDQRYVHNIIMTPHIVTHLTLTLNVKRNAGLDNAPAPRKDPCISVVLGALCTHGVESVGF